MTLSPRQQQIAALIARGWTDKQIGANLGIRPVTVRAHIAGIARAWQLDPAKDTRVQIAIIMRAAA